MHFTNAAVLINPYIDPLIETECVATIKIKIYVKKKLRQNLRPASVFIYFLLSNIINIYIPFFSQPLYLISFLMSYLDKRFFKLHFYCLQVQVVCM